MVPVYNESETVEPLAARIHEAMAALPSGAVADHEILFVDDGSRDGTSAVLERLVASDERVGVIRFRKNFGKAAALRAGFSAAAGDVVFTMDADLQDDPEELPHLLGKLDEGFDLVSGWKQNRQDPITKTVPSRFFNAVTSMASGLKLHDFNCGLKAYRAEAAKSLDVYGELHRYLPALCHWQGFKVTELPVRHHPRKYGVTKFGMSRFVNGFLDLLSVMFLYSGSRSPLHVFGRVGLFLGLIGTGILAYFGVIWIRGEWLRVRPLLIFGVVLEILATQFISLGLLGEMMARNQQQQRTYAVRERIGA